MSDRATRSRALNSGLRHSVLKEKNNKIVTLPGSKRNTPLSAKGNVKKILSPKNFRTFVKPVPAPIICQKTENYPVEASDAGSSLCDLTIYPSSVSSTWEFVGNNILDGLSSSETSSIKSGDYVFEGKDSDIISVWSLGSYSNDSYYFDSPISGSENKELYDINDPHNFLGTEKEIRDSEYSSKTNGTPTTLSGLTEKMALSSSSASDSSEKVYGLRSHRRRKV